MAPSMRIALVGDYHPEVVAHRAIPDALNLAADRLGVSVVPDWLHTSELPQPVAAKLSKYAAVWCVPASPYANMDGALAVIRCARETPMPFLGTCGGFQHAVIEYTRNVLGYGMAEHEETAPDAEMPVITRLSCSLVEKSAAIQLLAGSPLSAIYGQRLPKNAIAATTA